MAESLTQGLIVKAIEKRTGQPVFDIRKVEESLAKKAAAPPPPKEEEITSPEKFLKAGNIVTAVARGDITTAQRLYSQAPPEVKTIVKQQVDVQKRIIKAVPQPMSIARPRPEPVSGLVKVPIAKRTEAQMGVKIRQAEKEFNAAETAARAAQAEFKTASRTQSWGKYNQLVTKAQRHYRRAEDHGAEAERLSRRFASTLEPFTTLKKPVEVPRVPIGYFGGRYFGPEARQLQFAATRVLAEPEYRTRPATRELFQLRKRAAELSAEFEPLTIEAGKLEVVGKAAPYFPKEKYEDYVARVERLKTKIGEKTTEAKKVEAGLKQFEPFSMTKKRKQLIREHPVPVAGPLWGIMGESYGFLGGKAVESVFPLLPPKLATKVKVPPAIKTVFGLDPGREYVYGLYTSKRVAKEKAQVLGKMFGESVLIAGALKAGQAAIPKPTVGARTYAIPEGRFVRFETIGEVRGIIKKRPFYIEGVSTKDAFKKTLGKAVRVGKETTFTPSKDFIKLLGEAKRPRAVRLLPAEAGKGFDLRFGVPSTIVKKGPLAKKLYTYFKFRGKGGITIEPTAMKVLPKEVSFTFGKITVGKPTIKSIFADYAKGIVREKRVRPLMEGIGKTKEFARVDVTSILPTKPVKVPIVKARGVRTPWPRTKIAGPPYKTIPAKAPEGFPSFAKDWFAYREGVGKVPAVKRFPIVEGAVKIKWPKAPTAKPIVTPKLPPKVPTYITQTFVKKGKPTTAIFGRVTKKGLAETRGITEKGVKFIDISETIKLKPAIKVTAAIKPEKILGVPKGKLLPGPYRPPIGTVRYGIMKDIYTPAPIPKEAITGFFAMRKAEIAKPPKMLDLGKFLKPTKPPVTVTKLKPAFGEVLKPGRVFETTTTKPTLTKMLEKRPVEFAPTKPGKATITVVKPVTKPLKPVFKPKPVPAFKPMPVTSMAPTVTIQKLKPKEKPKPKIAPRTRLEQDLVKTIREKPKLKPFPVTKPIFREKVEPLLKPRARTKEEEDYLRKERQRIKELEKQARKTGIAEAVAQAQRTTEKTLIATGTMPITAQKIMLKPKEAVLPKTVLRMLPQPIMPTMRVSPWIPWLPKPTRRKEEEEVYGFRVLVRGKGKRVEGKWIPGKFKLLDETVLPRQLALALGQKKVRAKAARTFKIEPAFGKPGRIKSLTKFRPEMFVQKGRVFTERTKHAIDTYGELQEITKKGIRASQAKMRGNLFGPQKPIRKKKKQKRYRR